MKKHGEIEIRPEEIKELGKKILTLILKEFPGPISLNQMFLTIEALKSVTGLMEHQLKQSGVRVAYRREENT